MDYSQWVMDVADKVSRDSDFITYNCSVTLRPETDSSIRLEVMKLDGSEQRCVIDDNSFSLCFKSIKEDSVYGYKESIEEATNKILGYVKGWLEHYGIL